MSLVAGIPLPHLVHLLNFLKNSPAVCCLCVSISWQFVETSLFSYLICTFLALLAPHLPIPILYIVLIYLLYLSYRAVPALFLARPRNYLSIYYIVYNYVLSREVCKHLHLFGCFFWSFCIIMPTIAWLLSGSMYNTPTKTWFSIIGVSSSSGFRTTHQYLTDFYPLRPDFQGF